MLPPKPPQSRSHLPLSKRPPPRPPLETINCSLLLTVHETYFRRILLFLREDADKKSILSLLESQLQNFLSSEEIQEYTPMANPYECK